MKNCLVRFPRGGIKNFRGNSPGYMPRINTVNRSELVGGEGGGQELNK